MAGSGMDGIGLDGIGRNTPGLGKWPTTRVPCGITLRRAVFPPTRPWDPASYRRPTYQPAPGHNLNAPTGPAPGHHENDSTRRGLDTTRMPNPVALQITQKIHLNKSGRSHRPLYRTPTSRMPHPGGMREHSRGSPPPAGRSPIEAAAPHGHRRPHRTHPGGMPEARDLPASLFPWC
jgi:hypothetical protein